MPPSRAEGAWFRFSDFLTANRLPLSATTYFTYLGRLPHVEAISPARTDKGNCHRPSRQKGSGSRRGEQQGGELKRSAIPAIEPGEALDHFWLGSALLDVGKDAL